MLSPLFSATKRLTQRHLEWIYLVTTRTPLRVVAVSMLLVLFSSVVVATTRFEADIFKLFPSRIPAVQLLVDSLNWSGSSREAYFLLEGDPSALPAEAGKLAARLQGMQLDGRPAFNRVTWRVYDDSEGHLFADFISYAVSRPQLFVAPRDAARLAERLSPATFERSLKRIESELAGQFGGNMTQLAAADPLNIRELILPRLKAAGQALDLDTNSPYFLSRDGRVMIVIAEPARPIQDMEFARRLVAGINESREGLTATVSCAGAHISAVLDEAAMKSNITSCILSSLLVVLGIFYAVYRRLLPTILLPLIISVGVLFALASASIFLPSIHIISFAFMALIIGLGTDYSIHLYDRYHSERLAALPVEEALHLAVVDTGQGLFTAAATTAVPFLTLMISDVRALYELGLLVGLGVIFTLYATLFFLPPLLILMERSFPAPFKPIPSLGMRSLWKYAGSYPKCFIWISILLIISLSAAVFRLSFDGELKNLQPRHSEAFLTQEKIGKHLSLAPKQMLIAVDGSELGDVLERTGRVGTLLERYQGNGGISGWSSIGSVINDKSQQRAIIKLLASSKMEVPPSSALEKALSGHGFEIEPFREFIKAMSRFGASLPVSELEGVARLTASPLRGVVNRHLIRDDLGYHSLLYIYYKGSEFDQTAFFRELDVLEPGARKTGVGLVSSQLADSVAESFLWSFLFGGLIVIFLLLSHIKSGMGVFSPLFPVAAGAVCMLGSMALFGLGLNFMNAMVLVTIVGMGSDYGLHIYHRVGRGEDTDSGERFDQAGRAVLLSALTTVAGFGSLAFADYPALASIGWATNLGVGFTALFALVTLPSVMFINRRK